MKDEEYRVAFRLNLMKRKPGQTKEISQDVDETQSKHI